MLHTQRKDMMKNWMDFFQNNLIFQGLSKEAIDALLSQAEAKLLTFSKGQTILNFGDRPGDVYFILQGRAVAVRVAASGRELIYAQFSPGDVLWVFSAACRDEKGRFKVSACTDLTTLCLPVQRMLDPQANPPELQLLLLKNLATSFSRQYAGLLDRIGCIAAPSLREKVIQYLHSESVQQNSLTFSIPFDRASLAAFLNTDRSALSRELSNMKREGLIDFYKNSFKLTARFPGSRSEED